MRCLWGNNKRPIPLTGAAATAECNEEVGVRGKDREEMRPC
jgi:hypothetical protein